MPFCREIPDCQRLGVQQANMKMFRILNAAHRSLTHEGFCLVPVGKLLYLWTRGLQALAEVRCPQKPCTFHTTVAAQRKQAGAMAG